MPIYVPAEDEALVAELLTGLLDEKMTGLTTEGVEVRRYLVKRERRMASRPSAACRRRNSAGKAARHAADKSRPRDCDRRARQPPYRRCRAFRTAGRRAAALAGASVHAHRQAPDRFPVHRVCHDDSKLARLCPYPWTWPRGDALRSDVLVFVPDEGSTPNEPLLRFLRAGSVSSPAKTLYVLVPHGWTIEPATDVVVAETEDVPALGRKLIRLTAAAYFHSGEHDSVRFRVEPDADEREHELELRPFVSSGFLLADDGWELIASPTRPLIHEAGKQRPLRAGELFVRRPGGKWTALSGPLSGAGLMELSWRDPVANIQIEKRQLALVPVDARIDGTMKNALSGNILLHGLPGWTATVRETACAVDATDVAGLVIRFTGRPVYRLPMTLRPPAGQAFDVIVPLVGRDAVIALADGAILAPGRQVDIGALRGAVAVSPCKAILHLGARGFNSGIKTIVQGELPLGILARRDQ